jgi:hypothetical protein
MRSRSDGSRVPIGGLARIDPTLLAYRRNATHVINANAAADSHAPADKKAAMNMRPARSQRYAATAKAMKVGTMATNNVTDGIVAFSILAR